MALSDLEVFNEYAYSAMTEVVDQQVEKFNEASRNAIVLRPSAHQGDYSEMAFWKNLTGLVRRRNSYGSGTVSALDLEHLLDTSVKIAAGTPPVNIPPGQMRWIQRAPQEQGVVYGQQLAKAMMQDMLNTAITGMVAALSGESEVVYDGTAGTFEPSTFVAGTRLFGDAAERIVCYVMHSKAINDLWADNLANAERLFMYESINVMMDPFGRVMVVTDSDSLINTTPNPDQYSTLGLVAGACTIGQNNDFDNNIETKNGDENILRTIQSEWSYNLGIKGFAWDKTNGGPSPNDAAIAVATNWDRYSTSEKDLAGVLIKTQ